jgi:hypothetical protein
VHPGEILNMPPKCGPEHAETLEAVLQDFERLVLPGITHWNHPGFMAYFGITGSAPGILGDLVSSAINSNGMLWKTCPALTELERVVLRWYATALGLPSSWFSMITDTASTSTLVALAAAREQSAWVCVKKATGALPANLAKFSRTLGRDLCRCWHCSSGHLPLGGGKDREPARPSRGLAAPTGRTAGPWLSLPSDRG